MRIKEIIGNYIKDDIVSVGPVGEGHVNDTYLVTTSGARFICQQVKSVMDTGKLEHNFKLYSEAFRNAGILFPDWIKNRDGKYFLTDETGDNWRVYPLVEGNTAAPPIAQETLYACGQGLAKMHSALAMLPDTLEAVYPHLHDLHFYHEQYKAMFDRGTLIEDSRDAELEAIIDKRIESMLATESVGCAPVHGDAKLSNILFKDGRVAGFIDMDTVMLGSPLEDVADCIRSCCVTDGHLNREAAQTIADGYASVRGEAVREDKLRKAFDKICFELALRYYTDIISGAGYFKEHYPGDRLDKARSLINTTWD